jgi:hypothetical protein
MARRTVEVTIDAQNRDHGKKFLITEMAAELAEDWAMRAWNVMMKAQGGIDPDMLRSGMQGLTVAALSAFSKANYAEMKPLLDEMFACVQITEPKITRSLTPDDIEEVTTRLKLREEVLQLHLGFFKPAIRWIWMMVKRATEIENTRNTEMSPEPSEQ